MLVRSIALLVLAWFRITLAWDYSHNGADWKEQGMCGKGGAQSPISLPASAPTALEELTMFLKYPKLESALTVYNNGHSIAITLPETFRAGFGLGKGSDGFKQFDSEEASAYRLWQVNFHSPSEHTLNGERLPLEMQLVHQQVTGGDGLAVVVVLFNAAANVYDPVLDAILGGHGLPEAAWQETIRKPPFEFAPLLGGSPYFSYLGSLTVPPCEQQVKYFVRKEAVPAAQSQIRQFSKVLEDTCKPKGNFRLMQYNSGPVVLVGAVDLVTAPDAMVSPQKPKLQSEKVPLDMSACAGEWLDNVYNNLDRIQYMEDPVLSQAKTNFNFARRDLQTTENSIAAAERTLQTLQRQYDNAPGPVEKIGLKWQLASSKELKASAENSLGSKMTAVETTMAALNQTVLDECKKQVEAKAAAAAKKAEAQKKEEKHVKPTRHWEYPEPHVKLPHGFGGSPFSNKEPDGEEIVMSAKIAVNLKQPEAPESATTKGAAGKDMGVTKAGQPDKLLAIRLPVAPDAVGDSSMFSGNLVKALAEVGHLPESRLEVKEIKGVAIQQVHSLALAQEHAKEFPRRNLRRMRL